MTGQELALGSFNPGRAPIVKKRRGSASFIRVMSGAALLAVPVWIVATQLHYTPDSDLGYNLGIAGGTALLLTLIYPLSKRLRFIHSWVPLKHWFRAHMVCGILGPVLILLHSRFALESINGTLAFCSMWMVFLSGVTGRYLHTRIHRSLTDKRASLQALNRQIGISAEDVRSKFHFAPRVNQRLERFHSIVPKQPKGPLRNLWRMLALPFRLRWTYARASKDLKRAIKKRARKRAWPRAKKRQRLSYGKKMIRTYLEAVRSVARIDGYERLFSLWHFVHVPLLFWLVITGVIHVLAVHMY
jgi:hypothetical protein